MFKNPEHHWEVGRIKGKFLISMFERAEPLKKNLHSLEPKRRIYWTPPTNREVNKSAIKGERVLAIYKDMYNTGRWI